MRSRIRPKSPIKPLFQVEFLKLAPILLCFLHFPMIQHSNFCWLLPLFYRTKTHHRLQYLFHFLVSKRRGKIKKVELSTSMSGAFEMSSPVVSDDYFEGSFSDDDVDEHDRALMMEAAGGESSRANDKRKAADEENEEGDTREPKRKKAHNMSERMRRTRIRERILTLKKLILNCNKRDYASILDDAAKCIKENLQLIQMMSMNMSMAAYMSPDGYPNVYNPPVVPMRPGLGTGIGFGMEYPMFPPPTPSHHQSLPLAAGMRPVTVTESLPLIPEQQFSLPPAYVTDPPPTFNHPTEGESCSNISQHERMISQGFNTTGSSIIVHATRRVPPCNMRENLEDEAPHLNKEVGNANPG